MQFAKNTALCLGAEIIHALGQTLSFLQHVTNVIWSQLPHSVLRESLLSIECKAFQEDQGNSAGFIPVAALEIFIAWRSFGKPHCMTLSRPQNEQKKTGICKVIGLAPATHSLNEIKWNNCHLLVQRGNWAHASHNWRRIVTSVL